MAAGNITKLENVNTTLTTIASSATGSIGTIIFDSSYLYVCIGTNSWKRIPLSSF